MLGNMMLENMTALLPTFIKEKGWDSTSEDPKPPLISGFEQALILSIFSIAQIIFAPLNAIIKNKWGAKNTILFGFGILTLATFGLGGIARFENSRAFLYVALGLRFLQGQGDVLLQITGYSIVTSVFNDQVLKYMSYIEIAVGFGLGVGPVIGEILDAQFGYEITMYFFGLINLVGVLICFAMIPNELNQTASDEEVAEFQAKKSDLLTATGV
mmetsp:Transcript_12602/g.21202  ORF Transcript_12602/g.21202 Transcript_12602/m.21202 type:complete len:214 (+) Transcript_12602:209-850(+)